MSCSVFLLWAALSLCWDGKHVNQIKLIHSERVYQLSISNYRRQYYTKNYISFPKIPLFLYDRKTIGCLREKMLYRRTSILLITFPKHKDRLEVLGTQTNRVRTDSIPHCWYVMLEQLLFVVTPLPKFLLKVYFRSKREKNVLISIMNIIFPTIPPPPRETLIVVWCI